MRDQEIYRHFELLTDAVKADVAQLQRAVTLVRTRQDAFERLILGNRFGILRMVLFQLFMPSYVAKLMNLTHSEELTQFQEVQKRSAQRKSPIMKVPTPGLVVA